MAENNINIKKNNIQDTVQSFTYKTTYLICSRNSKEVWSKRLHHYHNKSLRIESLSTEKQYKFRLLSCCSWMHSPVPVPIIAKYKALMERYLPWKNSQKNLPSNRNTTKLYLGPHSDRPATNTLSYDMALNLKC